MSLVGFPALSGRIDESLDDGGPACGSTQSLEQQIAHVRQVSLDALRQLREALAPAWPDVGWTDEEDRPTSDAYWLYDAIDGAYHYLQGLPLGAGAGAGEGILAGNRRMHEGLLAQTRDELMGDLS